MVDDKDYARLSKYTWRLEENGYARTKAYGRQLLMHRMILGLCVGDGIKTDHKDTNKLNNQKNNLRVCTTRQNNRNSKSKGGISKYKGVSLTKHGTWKSGIKKNYEYVYLGCFQTELEAAIAYNEAAKELFGEFAKLNEL